MLDSENFLSHLTEEEDRLLGGYILDQIEIVLKRKQEQFTNFLNPYQRKIARGLLEQIYEINYLEEGGYRQAERKRIVVFPEYLFPDHIESSISILKISGNFTFQSLTHKDFLGALTGLGLKRERIGDILVLNDRAQVIVAVENKDDIILHLNRVHEVPVEVEEIDAEQLIIPEQSSKDIKTTVASMRLDAVASAGFGDSRSKIARDIKNGRVKLNWKTEENPSSGVEIGDLISIRKRGRVEVVENRGKSNRGRIKLLLKRYT